MNISKKIRGIIPHRSELRFALRSFSPREWKIFGVLALILTIGSLGLLFTLNNRFLIEVPTYGGSFTEGVVGTPRFVNPVLAMSDTDRDLSMLVYSGLMKHDVNGQLVPDLASGVSISNDGLEYTFTIREGAQFHDGKNVTADDVVYTVTQTKDALIKSPNAVSFEGVTVTSTDERTVVFTLRQRFASFLETMTIGILPKHVWEKLSPEQFSLSDKNLDAIGSGPYEIKKVRTDASGIPTSFSLERFNNHTGGKPFIKNITVKFYANENELLSAYKSGSVDTASALSPALASELKEKGRHILEAPLPRVFGLFFNKTEQPLLQNKEVLNAINVAINKDHIIDTVLHGFGTPITSPVPLELFHDALLSSPETTSSGDAEKAITILEKAGWTRGEDGIFGKGDTRLSLSLATSDSIELRSAAGLIRDDLRAIGIDVELKIFETGTLNQNIIRPRKYDMLFFGQIVNHPTDLFAFWHSSQRSDPGLNIAMYTNPRADTYLEEASSTLDAKKQESLYTQFEREIANDIPAVFIYSPSFIYAVDKHINGITLSGGSESGERFSNINLWYMRTERIWPFFHKEKQATITTQLEQE